MVQALRDGSPGEGPDLDDLEMLTVDVAPDGPSSPAGRDLGRWLTVVAALVVGVLLGAYAQSWLRDRDVATAAASATQLYVVDVELNWGGFQVVTVTASLRNAGTRDVRLEELQTAGGAVAPLRGVLPVTLPAGAVTPVALNFDSCGRSPSWNGTLDARVRTADGATRALALEVVGHKVEVSFVEQAVADACRDDPSGGTRSE